MNENLLEINNVSKIFGYGFIGRVKFRAVDKVSLTMKNEPSILTIAGESGCGKSTLARMILGLLEPNEGSIKYKGKDIRRLKGKDLIWFRKEVQAIFQDPYDTFNPMKKVETYLYETAKNLLGLKNRSNAFKRIDEALSFVGLSLGEIRNRLPKDLSGGQLQRISIARAFLSNPKLIVADEPVSMVDASMRMNIINIFLSLKKEMGISFIYITHDLATAYYISDKIAIMYRGMIVEEGPADKVLLKQYHPYTQALVSSLPELGKKKDWLSESENKATLEIKEFLAQGCKYAAVCPYKTEKCDKERPVAFMIDGVRVYCWLYEKNN